MKKLQRWYDLSSEGLEASFNPRATLGEEVAALIEAWMKGSAATTPQLPGPFDLRYGDHSLCNFDVHPGRDNHPLMIFIHGGAWRALDKSSMNQHVLAMHQRGWHVINMNYPLCPEVSITDIYNGLRESIMNILSRLSEWNITPSVTLVGGHSAGGHAACWLAREELCHGKFDGVVSVSGVYELGAIAGTSIQDDVSFSSLEIANMDLVTKPPQNIPILATVGGSEPEAWLASHGDFAASAGQSGCQLELFVIPNTNHFTVMDATVEGPNSQQLDDFAKRLIAAKNMASS